MSQRLTMKRPYLCISVDGQVNISLQYCSSSFCDGCYVMLTIMQGQNTLQCP